MGPPSFLLTFEKKILLSGRVCNTAQRFFGNWNQTLKRIREDCLDSCFSQQLSYVNFTSNRLLNCKARCKIKMCKNKPCPVLSMLTNLALANNAI